MSFPHFLPREAGQTRRFDPVGAAGQWQSYTVPLGAVLLEILLVGGGGGGGGGFGAGRWRRRWICRHLTHGRASGLAAGDIVRIGRGGRGRKRCGGGIAGQSGAVSFGR